ncbi:hypothetical protein JCM24511_01358 [Saitozyma sp. JCM 24511]|nr:hypothetical protein JCM24511_01358 [Saitozyma sp. JCM 24511]
MRFSTRNAFYLRASNYRVLPLFLYLDERHVDWMSDQVLQLVIAELQPKMPELLLNAKMQKKHKVYVERGEGYQFCYFLRSTTRTEVVLLKQKTFSLRPPTPPRIEPSPSPSPRKPSRSSRTPRPASARSRSITATSDIDTSSGGSSPPLVPVEAEETLPSRETEVEVKPDPDALEEEVNIKDWKPDVSLSYKGFGTSSLQLVLIIEPYPPLDPEEYAPPSSRLSSRSASIVSSRSRSRTKGGGGTTAGGRYSSVSLSLAPDDGPTAVHAPNMRNASRSVSATPVPNSRTGGSATSATPFGRDSSSTPGPSGSGSGYGAGYGRRGATPLFIPGDTPFGEDDEDEEAHQAYTEALREGRLRLPSVSRPAGPDLDAIGKKGSRSRSVRRSVDDEDDEDMDDVPDSIMEIGQRLVRSSQIEESVVRVQGGWEERGEGEESAVMGREEPGD